MRSLFSLICFSIALLLPVTKSFAETSATKFLPPTVVIYAETGATGDLLSDLLEHPQREKIESLPAYQKWLGSDEHKKLMMVTKLIESQLGTSWQQAIEKLGAGGIHLALDGATQSMALLVKSDDELFLEKAKNAIVNLSLLDAAGKGKSVPFQPVDYRGVQAYRADQVRFAIVGKWLVLSNSSELGKGIIDSMLDGLENSLADAKQFRAALATRPSNSRAWAYADLKTIRSVGIAKALLGGKSKNPGVELLFGGVLNTLHETPYATANVATRTGSMELSLKVPHNSEWTPAEREFFFGSNDSGTAPPPMALSETILEARVFRGVSGMWLHGPDLFDEEINAGLAKANSDLSTLFGGRPFAEDILGALDGGLRLLVVREPIDGQVAAKSTIQLPGFAAVARLKDPKSTQRPLRIAFQTAVGFVNLTGAQQGRPPLEMETERSDGKVLLSASYAPEDLAGDDKMAMAASGGGVLLQLSPTLGFVNESVVVASTRTLAEKILDKLADNSQGSLTVSHGSVVTNSAVQILAEPLRLTLAENRDRLINNNMLEKGHDRVAAEREIDGLLTLLEFFEHGDSSLRVSDDQLELSLRLTSAKE